MKKVFVNGLSALLGGGQTYLMNLFSETPDAEIHVALPDELAAVVQLPANVRQVRCAFAQKSVLHRLLWENFILPRYLRFENIDVYYQPSGMLPLFRLRGGVQSAIAFRNMLPFAQSEIDRFALPLKRLRYRLLRFFLGVGFRRADLVVFVSKYAQSVIETMVPHRKGASVTVYHGVNESFRTVSAKPPGLPDEYVLYVSILNYYKAQVEVVQAWSMVRARRKTREKLVLLGPEVSAYAKLVRREVDKLQLKDEVVFIPKVAHKQLAGYYQHAKINLFASSCENCPNILLEQLAAGRAILCSNVQPMPEIAGPGALYFDPYGPEDLCQLILDIIDDPAKLAKMGVEASRRAEAFSWEKTRRETWQALLSL